MSWELKKVIVKQSQRVRDVKLSLNQSGARFCLVVDDDYRLVGTITDGDLRRSGCDDQDSLTKCMQSSPVTLPAGTPIEQVSKKLSERVTFIPLVDERGKLVDCVSLFQSPRVFVASPVMEGNEAKYISQCLRENWISSQGPFVKRFEEMLAQLCQQPHALATSSGTTALHTIIEALGIGKNDEVIVPNLTFASTASAVLHAGAEPVLVDVDPQTWNISPREIVKALSPRTKAIIPVHLYGLPCDMSEILKIVDKHNLYVIEDCAESIGSKIDGRPVGSFGDAAMFSFYANKTVTTGEGGMAIFRDSQVFERAKILRDHGMSPKKRYWHECLGYNYRMTNLQAAIGTAQLERVDSLLKAKLRNAAAYEERISQIPGLSVPPTRKDMMNTFWLYTIRVHGEFPLSRDDLMGHLKELGIETRSIFYPLDEMPVFSQCRKVGKLLVSKKISYSGISLPSSANLTLAEIDQVCHAIEHTYVSTKSKKAL